MTVNNWTLERIREHLDSSLPLVSLFNIAVLDVSEECGAVRLGPSEHVTRHGGITSGPVQFALADVAIYALILAARRDPAGGVHTHADAGRDHSMRKTRATSWLILICTRPSPKKLSEKSVKAIVTPGKISCHG